jgi:hypothetical protein
MTDKPIIPFTCEICNSQFHELAGSKCSICGKVVCRVHLKGKVCTECHDKKIPEQDPWFRKATKKDIFLVLFVVIYVFAALIIQTHYSVIIGLIMFGLALFVVLIAFFVTPIEKIVIPSKIPQFKKKKRVISLLIFLIIISGLIGIISAIFMRTGVIDRKIDNKFIIIELSIIAVLILGYWIFFSKRKI